MFARLHRAVVVSRSLFVILALGIALLTHADFRGGIHIEAHAVTEQLGLRYYIAVVPAEHPWREPEYEEILDRVDVARSLPIGRYRVLVGAVGCANATAVMNITASDEARIQLSLLPLATVSGRVLDIDGGPIANARIGLPGNFRLDYFDTLSAMGEGLLRSNSFTTTDENGVFLLPVNASGSNHVFVEADGYAPAMLVGVTASDGTVREVRLRRGATVSVAWKAGATPYNRLLLIPRRVELPANLSRSGAIALWSRPLEGASQHWRSVPSGSYSLCLAVPDEYAPQRPPRCLADFTLGAGSQRDLTVTLPALSPKIPQSPPDLRVSFSGIDSAELAALHVSRWSDIPADRMATVPGVQHKGSVISISHGCVPGSRYYFETPRFLAATKTLGVGCGKTKHLTMYERSEAMLRLATVGSAPPRQGLLRFITCSAARGEQPASITVPFSVGSGGVARVPAPAGCFFPTLYAPPCAEHPFPQWHFAAGTGHMLGAVTLQFGGSLTAHVVDGSGNSLIHADIRLLPQTETDRYSGMFTDAVFRPVGAAVTDDEGWIKLTGLRDDAYVLSALMPGRTLPVLSKPFTIRPREPYFLEDFIVEAPAAVHVRLHGARALPFPVVSCVAHPSGVATWPATWSTSTRATEIGCSFEDLPSGTWDVSPVVRAARETTELAPSTVVAQPGANSLDIDVAQSIYRGSVLDRGAPVSRGLLQATGPLGETPTTVSADLARDGTFVLPLRRGGVYRVEISSVGAKRLRAAFPQVRFSDSKTEVHLAIPQGGIAGLVIHPSGEPVPGAAVHVRSTIREATGSAFPAVEGYATTNAKGQFFFTSLAPGDWILQIRDPHFTSETILVSLESSQHVDNALLVAQPAEAVDGKD